MAETLTLSLPQEVSEALKERARAHGSPVPEEAVRLLTEAVHPIREAPLAEAELRETVAPLAAGLTLASQELNEWLRQILVAEVEDSLLSLWRRRPVAGGPWTQVLAVLLDVLRLNPGKNLHLQQLRALSSLAAPLASVEWAPEVVTETLDHLEEVGLTTFPLLPDEA